MSLGEDLLALLGRTVHAHSLDEANQGIWREGDFCSDCPKPTGPAVVTSIDYKRRVITIGSPVDRSQ